ncbi:MAG: hypothetical protein ACFFCZ_30805 [Promethearchaeota archaeon]
MVRSKYIRLLIPIILGFFVLTAAIPVQAGRTELRNLPADQRIFYFSTITASEKSFVAPAIWQADSEKGLYIYLPPYNIRVFIDGEEIKLLRFSYYDKTSDNPAGEPAHFWVFYHIFEPDYFETGTHTLRFEFYYYNGQGKDRTQVSEFWPELEFYVV